MLLGIDVGTSGTKALLCRPDGRVAATATAEHPIQRPQPGWSEQRPADWWRSTVAAVRAVLRKARCTGRQVRGIGLSGQMHGSVFLDKAGRVIRPALLWNDQRTGPQCEAIERAAGGRAALIRMVNNPALTGYTAPKVLWLREAEPRAYDRLATILLPKDYIRLRLTGEYATDVADASGTLLLDVRRRRWHRGLLDRLGIDAGLLPPLVESPEPTGGLTASAARTLGLTPGTMVVGGAGDQPAGAVGNGIVTAGVVSATMGTSGVIFAHAAGPVDNREGNLQSFCHAMPGAWCVFGCMLSAGGSLQWLRDTLWADETQTLRKAGRDPGVLYESMIAEAAKAPAGCAGLIFLPYLTGERCPHADPEARGAWVGLTARHTRCHLVRSVIEGVTMGMRDQVELMRGRGIAVRQVRAGGGGARNGFWRQMQADMYHAPVATISTNEGAALGAALLAGVGTGCFAGVPEACRSAIRVRQTLRPSASGRKVYDAAWPVFTQLYRDLKSRFRELENLK
ncbi:MAG: Xylulose kinase [Phycisphaerae bacterium]|nr:Xylulose kinase [Phycisphaerae bacterium]